MATPDNYFHPPTDEPPSYERIKLIMQRLESVIEGADLIRKECNRIRNEFLSLGQQPDAEFLGLLSHLSIDVVYLRVKVGYMAGYGPDKMLTLTRHLREPMSQLSNEDPA